MERNIYTIYGSDACSMTMALMEKADIASRIPSKDARICMKPNLVVAREPESGATTHTGILEGVIRYLQGHGFKNIDIIEGSWVGDSTRRAFSVTGYDRLAKQYNVGLYDLKSDATRSMKTPIGNMDVCCRALEADYLINLPVLKGHCQTVMTCALKNGKGCLPDREKRHFHSLGLMKPIAALSTVLKPDLIIVDSICGDLNFEEGGTPVQTNRMMLGFDPVQMDTYGCQLMGIDPYDVDYIPLAEKYGSGSMEVREEDIIALNDPKDARGFPPRSGLVSSLTKKVQQKNACSACYGALVHALYRMQEEGRPFRKEISIGQGFQDVPIDGIGIGRCCNCAKIGVQGCPPTAESIMYVLNQNR
ncbi:MAG: DUF362 domain-containing protein [Oscillospiraceae bacterium]|nr:DUF362 domain-containing protein [Oscillospiraceae bacterium]